MKISFAGIEAFDAVEAFRRMLDGKIIRQVVLENNGLEISLTYPVSASLFKIDNGKLKVSQPYQSTWFDVGAWGWDWQKALFVEVPPKKPVEFYPVTITETDGASNQ